MCHKVCSLSHSYAFFSYIFKNEIKIYHEISIFEVYTSVLFSTQIHKFVHSSPPSVSQLFSHQRTEIPYPLAEMPLPPPNLQAPETSISVGLPFLDILQYL